MLSHEPKALKPSQLRIVLRDGRELQYHPPFKRTEPLDLRQFLPAERAPLEVEIGPGKGEFLARRAGRVPGRYFLGIDRRLDRIRLTEKKLKRLSTNDPTLGEAGRNWKIVREDARSFLLAGLPPIEILHVYHPDPWPKSRHHKHRFFRSPDARAWAEAIVKGGELRLSTDHAAYFEEIMDVCLSWEFMRPKVIYQKTRSNSLPQSHFEGIFLRKNQPVFKAIFERL